MLLEEDKALTVPKAAEVADIDHQVLKPEEAAQFLRVRKAQLYNLVRQDAIPYRRIGQRYIRFWKSDLVKFMHGEE